MVSALYNEELMSCVDYCLSYLLLFITLYLGSTLSGILVVLTQVPYTLVKIQMDDTSLDGPMVLFCVRQLSLAHKMEIAIPFCLFQLLIIRSAFQQLWLVLIDRFSVPVLQTLLSY